METVWFALVALMITAYVVLDGFDLGAGIVYLLSARNDDERRLILRSIGPVWDGNEVWLIASGGALYFAFPRLYAASFSGFYLPLMIVLWLLMMRGVGIELRSHVDNELWRSFFDFIFSVASLLLAVFFGAALGNVVRGVPLNGEGFFFEPLWTNFRATGKTGILDWYTILTGVVALVALTSHGARYIAMKTEGEMQNRARRVARSSWWLLLVVTILSFPATASVRPQILDNYKIHIWGAIFPLAAFAGLIGIWFYGGRGRDAAAFFASTLYLVGMLGGAAFGLYPYLLPSSFNLNDSLTVFNSSSASYGLHIGLIWWSIGIVLAISYFVYLYTSFRGKVKLEGEGY